MSNFQFESSIDKCLERFNAPLANCTTPRWKRKRCNSLNTSVPLSPYNGNLSSRTPYKTPKRIKPVGKTPMKTPRLKKTPHKTPVKNTPQFDRFISTRAVMDNEKNYFKIMNEEDSEFAENEQNLEVLERTRQEKVIKENLNEDCSSRILHFKQSAPAAREGYQNNLRVVYSQNRGSSKVKSSRYIPKVPEKILDAPDLMNDFYLNLVDWGCNNCIAIGLTSGVYFCNYETQSTKQVLQLPNDDYVSSVSWVKDGNVLAVGSSNTNIQLWDVETEKCLRTLCGHSGRVGSLAWNSCILTSGGRSGKIINHDVRVAQHIVSTLNGHSQDICGLAWSSDGRTLASGGNDNLVNVWYPFNNCEEPLHSLTHHQAAVKAVSWCPWQRNVLSTGGGTADRCIRFWNVTSGSCLNTIDTKSQISSILWSKEFKELITSHGFSMNQLTIWKYPTMSRVADLTDHAGRILCMTMSPNGEYVASVAADETLRIWKCFDQSQLKKRSTTVGLARSSSKTNLNMINKIR